MLHPDSIDSSKLTPWAEQMISEFNNRTCNTFVLTGNVGDYAKDNIDLDTFLQRILGKECGFEHYFTFDITNLGTYVFKEHLKSGMTCTANVREYVQKHAPDCCGLTLQQICEIMKMRPELEPDEARSYNMSALIVKYPEKLAENNHNAILLNSLLRSREFFRSRSIIIFVTDNPYQLNDTLFGYGVKKSIINIPLPDFNARKRLVMGCHTLAERRNKGYASELSDSELARVTAGLTLQQIEDLILECDILNPITQKSATEKKASIISTEYSNIIELMDAGSLTLDSFAGQDSVKQYFKEVIIDAIKVQKLSIVPKGVLLMGPPGTGKSFFAKCLAGSAGINCVNFKMSKILDKYVGVGEKRLDQAFRVFHAMAPVIVFIDEMDQVISRGKGDSGPQVYSHIFGSFLAELSKPENRGKIIWLGATNYPNMLDEALKRTGRFDKKIPFFAPSDEERAEVIKKHLQKAGSATNQIDYVKFAQKTEGYTQAEIEGVIVKALELASRRAMPTVTDEILELALGYMIHASNSKIKEMEDIALLECNDLEFIPQKYRERRTSLADQQ